MGHLTPETSSLLLLLLCLLRQVRKALRGDESKEPKEAEDGAHQLREEATPLREW